MRAVLIIGAAIATTPAIGQSVKLPDGFVIDDPVVSPAPAPLPRGPAYLIVSNRETIRMIPYKSMAACERARRYASGPPAGTPAPGGGVYGPPAVTYSCVPR